MNLLLRVRGSSDFLEFLNEDIIDVEVVLDESDEQ
jgi:hypothetical protein